MKAGLPTGCLVLLAALAQFLTAQPLMAQSGLEVIKVVLAEPEIEPGGEQLVQVSMRNRSGRRAVAGLRAEIRSKDGQTTGIIQRKQLELPPGAERRAFLRMRAPDTPGEYRVRLVVLTANFKKHLLADKPVFSTPFVVSGNAAAPAAIIPQSAGRKASVESRVPSFKPGAGLQFEKPDLLWENFLVSPRNVLVGELLKVKGDLRNVGGDIARDIAVKSTHYNIRLPRRLHDVSSTTVKVLAPGEKIELEFEYRFPDDTLLGDYQFSLEADYKQKVSESNERNNRELTTRAIRVSTILQTFPEPDFAFDQTGLFLFRWRSSLYNEFKVQVGTETTFEQKDRYFDIPQGGKWTSEQEVVPLPGELPGMLLGLMMKDDASVVYWRVMGRVAGTNRVGFSKSLPFNIRIEEEETPATPPASGAGGGGGKYGGG